MNRSSQNARTSRGIWPHIAYIGIFAAVVTAFAVAFVFLAKSPTSKDAWEKVDIVAKAIAGIAGVLIPGVIAWGIHVYNKRQRQVEMMRETSEFRLRQLDTARQFLPQLLSEDTAEKWAAIDLIQVLGDEDLARKIADWLVRGYLRQEDRGRIERLMKHKDPHIAELAARAFRSISSPPVKVTLGPSPAVEAGYMLKTSDPVARPEQISFDDNVAEQHGLWVVTRGQHTLVLPAKFRIGIYLVTNEFFLEFVRDHGYTEASYWSDTPPGASDKCLSQDRRTLGPSTWPSGKACLPGRERHPVAGIGYYEALAFCNWLQKKHPPSEAGWKWRLPTEDMWEFCARTEEGRSYPWGHEFIAGFCNSVETGNRTTTDVNMYPAGHSRYECLDMAGNVWEFVVADDQKDWSCVLKGGSFRNNQHEVKSYLRLFGVPRDHRPPDFGFRCSQAYEPDRA